MHARREGRQAKERRDVRTDLDDRGHRRGVRTALHAEAAGIAVGVTGVRHRHGGRCPAVVDGVRRLDCSGCRFGTRMRMIAPGVPLARSADVTGTRVAALGIDRDAHRRRCRARVRRPREVESAHESRRADHCLEREAGEQNGEDEAAQAEHRRENTRGAAPAA